MRILTTLIKSISFLLFMISQNHLLQAGGIELEPLNTSFMYSKGTYASVAMTNRNYEVKDNFFAPSYSALKDINHYNISVKSDLAKNFDIGVTYYSQAAVQVDYANGGSIIHSVLPVVDMWIDSLTVLGRYSFNDYVSIIAGVKDSIVKNANADIYRTVNVPPSRVTGRSKMGFVAGVALGKPDIALRAELLFESQTKFSLPTVNDSTGTGKTTGSVPEYLTLNLQSGIFKNTLAFASLRKANWSENNITVYPDLVGDGAPTSNFENSHTFSFGIGHKLSDEFSLYGTYSFEKSGDHTSTSLLSITDGYESFGYGGILSFGDFSLTIGHNRSNLGDVTVNVASYSGAFKNNSVNSFYIKLAYNK